MAWLFACHTRAQQSGLWYVSYTIEIYDMKNQNTPKLSDGVILLNEFGALIYRANKNLRVGLWR